MDLNDLLTKEDLQQFKAELFDLIKGLKIKPGTAPSPWLKSYEVRKLLKISPGTLQNLRVNGTLAYTKIGGLMYYKYEDVIRLLENGGGK
ncbi:helix-turn-helix domain-containing protein [Desertivirga brevis]|uniref:helix-turn-helix domain-containing protein n=1 Tax=Desertivirga brevis TaxID=2810310 RepID=UPI001A95FDE7|nr:helix-turn-helix domain-containing protein [Pedobacter sp. SYSU D00873]